MGWFGVNFGGEEREIHRDGSYTDRNERTGSSETYNSDGSLREYSSTEVPIIGPSHVDTYDSQGNLVNSQYKE